tara:strand:- start:162 stop:830 length:669 start_codon:yes stop_codon:yes gene_type:complete
LVDNTVLNKIKKLGVSYRSNDNISKHLTNEDRVIIQNNVEIAVKHLLNALIIDSEHDHNTMETHKRVAKMYVKEVFKGRYEPRPKITDFPNIRKLDEIYTVGPISIRSMCSHHMVPIFGKCWIGVIPSDKVIGLSKFNRVADWIMSRPQIQEEAAMQLADEIESIIKPKALAVIVNTSHMCMSLRGVKDNDCKMATSVMRGLFKNDSDARSEFLDIIKGQGF